MGINIKHCVYVFKFTLYNYWLCKSKLVNWFCGDFFICRSKIYGSRSQKSREYEWNSSTYSVPKVVWCHLKAAYAKLKCILLSRATTKTIIVIITKCQ